MLLFFLAAQYALILAACSLRCFALNVLALRTGFSGLPATHTGALANGFLADDRDAWVLQYHGVPRSRSLAYRALESAVGVCALLA